MFARILVANRGEIALRIIRACRELGIEAIAVYSEADRGASYLRLADASICIGPPPSSESYLNIPAIISAAEIADVQAIHPGCGFLAENAHFAEICESCNIRFIGPSPKAMQLAGNKVMARQIAAEHKIPVIPGGSFLPENVDEAINLAHEICYPVMIKAAMGGGGRGMRVAHNDISLASATRAARAEAEVSFKDGSLYLEKHIEGARHIEVQILGDEHRNTIHLGDRECSLQRRHQKLIEEAPAPSLSNQVREEILKAALRLAEATDYTNAGTVEFLVDKAGNFFFIEMNARLQVEHPVTEMTAGVDLVKEQIRIAAGERLSLKQRAVRVEGVSIECRINAEDPGNGFKPCPGVISTYIPPGGLGVRLDSHVHGNYEVTPFYDSLLAKLLVHSQNRAEAIRCMRRALDEFVIEGVKTTIPFCQEIMDHSRFLQGKVYTTFIDELVGGQ